MPDLVVAGAGMGGLVAAARARELGASVDVYEKGDRPGGSMLLSGGFVWRYRDFETFRSECPGGNPELQRLLFDRLDEGLSWLEGLGAPVLERETGNPVTTGVRFDTAGLTDSLVARVGAVRLGEALSELPPDVPVVLATGGFQADRELVRRHITSEADSLVLRANPWSAGDGLRLGLDAGAQTTDGMDEFWGRTLAAAPEIAAADFRTLSLTFARFATVVNANGDRYLAKTWSEIDVAQWTARQPGARAWFHVQDEELEAKVRDRTVGEMIEAARAAGAPVIRHEDHGETVVEVAAGITSTLGGLRIGPDARAAHGVYACGADVGGISTGGWASILASALVFGRIAAESALESA